jgi:hypothetical protein
MEKAPGEYLKYTCDGKIMFSMERNGYATAAARAYLISHRLVVMAEVCVCVCVCVCLYLTSGGQRHVAPALGEPIGL